MHRRILISGSTGLVGRALVARVAEEGYEPVALKRSGASDNSSAPVWAPIKEGTWSKEVGTVDAVVHLAGEPIAARRWTDRQKQKIRDSRVIGTRQLCEYLANLNPKPSTFICASATGYYGDRGAQVLTESSSPGDGFLPEVTKAWEAAGRPARDAGIRVINLRIGVVLAREGGALPKMLPAFKAGLAGKLGDGQQYMSWIELDDLVEAVLFCLHNEPLYGAINAVAPQPVTNEHFTKALGGVLKRPTFMPVPGFALRLMMGEMADELLLASFRVEPRRLLDAGFPYRHQTIESALRSALGRSD